MLLQNLYTSFSTNGAFTDVQVLCALMHPTQILAFEPCSDNKPGGPSLLFNPENAPSISFPKIIINFHSSVLIILHLSPF